MEESNLKRNELAIDGQKGTVLVHALCDERKREPEQKKEQEQSGKRFKKTFRKKKKDDANTSPQCNRSIATATSDATRTSRPDTSSPSSDFSTFKTESQADVATATERMSHVKIMMRNLCSRAANSTKRKLRGMMTHSKNPIPRLNVNLPTLRTTDSHHGFEISIQSTPPGGGGRYGTIADRKLKILNAYKRAAGNRMGSVAQKLSSFRNSGDDDEKDDDPDSLSNDDDESDGDGDGDGTQISSTPTVEEVCRECPICLGYMSDNDWNHPLQCRTTQCRYNFCSLCINNFIKSSQDPYEEASDGSHQVKVHLRCPNCRCKLDKILKRTLLLRTVDDKTLPGPERKAIILELSGVSLLPEEPLMDEQRVVRMNQIETEVCRARAEERDFMRSKPSAAPIGRSPEAKEPSQVPQFRPAPSKDHIPNTTTTTKIISRHETILSQEPNPGNKNDSKPSGRDAVDEVPLKAAKIIIWA